MNFRFTPDQRIRNRSGFHAVYATRRSRRAGPLLVFVRRGTGEFGPRLGLSLPKRVGSAVVRNRIRRRLREAFRLQQHDWPSGVDVVINVRQHESLETSQYGTLLKEARQSLIGGDN